MFWAKAEAEIKKKKKENRRYGRFLLIRKGARVEKLIQMKKKRPEGLAPRPFDNVNYCLVTLIDHESPSSAVEMMNS